MSEVDRQIARSAEVIERARQRQLPKPRGGIAGRAIRALKYAAAGVTTVLLAAFILGLFIPLGVTGAMVTVLAMGLAVVLALLLSRDNVVNVDALPKLALSQLPSQTERWLQSQRMALPAPAATLVDGIGVQLDLLSAQLATINEKEPVASDIRRLIGEELPELVKGYQRVPQNIRKDGLNGISPDKQLVDGLAAVDGELKRLSEQLAAGDLNHFATQGRYLEMKYTGVE